jgi:tetratricopeptide (TPR) repeat protein
MEATGNVKGAIQFLEDHQRRKGPTGAIANSLAILYANEGQWDDAFRSLDEAERLLGRHFAVVHNRGFFLWKSSQPAAALPLLEEAMRLAPQFVATHCIYGQALVDLGRTAEATEQLAEAERIVEQQRLRSKSEWKHMGPQIDDLRKRLASTGQP